MLVQAVILAQILAQIILLRTGGCRMMGRRSVPSLSRIIPCHVWYVLAIFSTASFCASNTCTNA